MTAHLLADLVLVLHIAFIVFVVAGAIGVLRWPRLAFFHLPSAAWGAIVELAGWTCPLTPLEISLRRQAGLAGYAGGFIDHYVGRIVYPHGLTRSVQSAAGAFVIVINVFVYARVLRRRRRGARLPDSVPSSSSVGRE